MGTTNQSLPRAGRGARPGRFTARGEWLLLGSSMAVSLGLLELFLRLFFPLFASPYQPDDVLLVKHVPGASKVFTRMAVNGGQRIVSQFNSQGFRGPQLRPLDHLRRVIVYGDSSVQAEFSELSATFAKQLEAQLARGDGLAPTQGPGIEVINAGVVGDGPDQVSLRLRDDLERLKPALVVVVVFADNDFGDLIRNRIYKLNARGEIELNHYHLAPQWRANMQTAAHPQGLHRLQVVRYAAVLRGMLRERWSPAPLHSPAEGPANYIEQSLTRNQLAFRTYMADRSGDGIAADPFEDYYDADIALQPDSPSARYKEALMEKTLMRLRDTVARAATELALVILPSPVDACDPYDVSVDTRRYPQYDRTRLSGLVEDMATRNGIPNINLWHEFTAEDANRYYFHGGDDHWNDAGQAKAAQLLAAFIRRRQLLEGSGP